MTAIFPHKENRQQNFKYLALIGTLLTYWYFGFHPFEFQLPIGIKKNTASHQIVDGVQFSDYGIGYTPDPPKWLKSAIAESTLDIKLEFKSTNIKQRGPARIFTISKDLRHRNLTIGQDGADLILRIRTRLSNQNGYPPYRFKNVFKNKKWQQLHLSITPDKLNIVINNETVSNFIPHNPMSQWSEDYRLAIGNEFTNNRPWRGIIRHAIVENKAQQIDYAIKKNLQFPKYLTWVQASYHFIPFLENPLGLKTTMDWVVNLLGFAPFGFLLIIFTKNQKTAFKAVIICFLLSLSIEIGQLFVVKRVSEIEDLILNTLGGFLGALIGSHYRQIA